MKRWQRRPFVPYSSLSHPRSLTRFARPPRFASLALPGSLSGRVFYATPGKNYTGCHNYEVHKNWQNEGKYILMVDRGSCNFVSKVRYAEQQGAMGVIVVDNYCRYGEPEGTCNQGCPPRKDASDGNAWKCPNTDGDCSSALTKTMTPFPEPCGSRYDLGLPVMADDGSGHNIAIPSYIISKYDGQVLKNAICSGQGTYNPPAGSEKVMEESCHAQDNSAVIVTLRWDLPKPDGIVDWSLWTSAEDWHGATFKQEFKDIAGRLAGTSKFSPMYFFYDGTKPGYSCEKASSKCGSQCLSNMETDPDKWKGGFYCRPDPDGQLDSGITGADIAAENLRQLCLWGMKNGTIAGQKMWWEYANLFALNCFGLVKETKTLNKCHTLQLSTAGITLAEQTQLDECVTYNSDKKSPLLDAQIEAKKSLNILVLPTITVRGKIMRGGTQPLAVLKEICSGYLEGTAPDACAAALDPLGDGQATTDTDGNAWKVTASILLSGLLDELEFTYSLQQSFKQRLGLELGVVFSSILLTSVARGSVTGADGKVVTGVQVDIAVSRLISADSAQLVKNKLTESAAAGYFTLLTDDEKPILLLPAGGGSPTIIKTNINTPNSGGGTGGAGTTTITGVGAGVVVVIVLIVLAFVGVAGVWYYRRTQAQMRAQVRPRTYLVLDHAGVDAVVVMK